MTLSLCNADINLILQMSLICSTSYNFDCAVIFLSFSFFFFAIQALFSSSSITTRVAACTGCELWVREISWTSQWVSCKLFLVVVISIVWTLEPSATPHLEKEGKGERWRQLLTSACCRETWVRPQGIFPKSISNVRFLWQHSHHMCSILCLIVLRSLLQFLLSLQRDFSPGCGEASLFFCHSSFLAM